jgi:hypothetical protein
MRLTREQWERSRAKFRRFLERYKPGRVLVLGRATFEWLPDPREREEREGDWRRYRLKDGSVVVCRMIRHPSRGIGWETVRDMIAELRVASKLTRQDRVELDEFRKSGQARRR